MLGVPTNTITLEDNLIGGSMKSLGSGWFDIFLIKNYTVLCDVDYYSKFPVIKKLAVLKPMTQLRQLKSCSQNLDFQG